MSQNEVILNHLKTIGSITPMEALLDYGCFRLGARIYDLKRSGYNIVAKAVEANGKRFAEYRLA